MKRDLEEQRDSFKFEKKKKKGFILIERDFFSFFINILLIFRFRASIRSSLRFKKEKERRVFALVALDALLL